MKKFKFSIIMPIYNVEKYLEEAILSVVNQTIGFEDNIQLVLVNDETPDNSVSIIKKYQSLYPENVVFVDKKMVALVVQEMLGLKRQQVNTFNA